jgi:hypothetical protein
LSEILGRNSHRNKGGTFQITFPDDRYSYSLVRIYMDKTGEFLLRVCSLFRIKKSQKKGEKVKDASRFSPSRLGLSEGRSKK